MSEQDQRAMYALRSQMESLGGAVSSLEETVRHQNQTIYDLSAQLQTLGEQLQRLNDFNEARQEVLLRLAINSREPS